MIGLELLLPLANRACLAAAIIHEIDLTGMSCFAEITDELILQCPATTEVFGVSGDAHLGSNASVMLEARES